MFLPRGAYGAIPLFPLPLVFLPISPIFPLIPPIPPCPPTLGVLIPPSRGIAILGGWVDTSGVRVGATARPPPPAARRAILWTQNHPGLGPKITKNKKIHEMGRRGSVWRETGAGFLVRPPRTSWDRSLGLPGFFFMFFLRGGGLGGPWAPCWGSPYGQVTLVTFL